MDTKNLNILYDRLIKDENFDQLDLGLKNPNIFQILRITNNEIRHSNFFSWLLDPNQSHKLGDIFLKRFLREVFSSDKFEKLEQVDVEGLDLSKVEIKREWQNIDILIKLENIVVCIENKVKSKEHSNQLNRYKDIIYSEFPDYEKTFVYLTVDGNQPEDESLDYEPISYEFIVETLERILNVYGESLGEEVKNYLKDYVTIIKRELMKTDKLTILAQKIYQNHREIFDFIDNHKPDKTDDFRKIMKEELLKKDWIEGSVSRSNYIRFLTPKIQNLIYYNKETKNGWNKNETFLFEIYFAPYKKAVNFRTVISPSDKNYNIERLEQIILEVEGATKSRGRKWILNLSINQEFDFDEIYSMSNNDLKIWINNFFTKINPTINKVEDKFVEYENELIKMKNV